MKKIHLAGMLLLPALLMPSWGKAADAKAKPKAQATPVATLPPAPNLRRPIVAKWTTLEGMQYYYSGIKISRDYEGLKAIILPLDDPEATGLLHKSEDDFGLGLGGVIGGGTLMLTGLLTSDYNSQTRVYSVPTASAVLLIAGTVVDLVGALMLEESNTTKFAAVERYNQVVRGEDEPSVENWKAAPAGLSVAFGL